MDILWRVIRQRDLWVYAHVGVWAYMYYQRNLSFKLYMVVHTNIRNTEEAS